MKSNTGQLYKVKTLLKMYELVDNNKAISEDMKDQFTEYDVYEKVRETSATVTVWHVQLDLSMTMSLSEFYASFEPYNSKDVILRPIVPHSDIMKYLKDKLNMYELEYNTGLLMKVSLDSFNNTDDDVLVKIQYSKCGFKFRKYVQIVKMMPKEDILRMFNNPMSRYISDMNLFDRLTVNKNARAHRYVQDMGSKYEGLVYFYGYSTTEGSARILRGDLDKDKFASERTSFIIANFSDIDIFIRDYKYINDVTENSLEFVNDSLSTGEEMRNMFDVVNTKHEVLYPKSVGEGLVITFKSGTVHMLINNLSLVKGASFKVIEVGKRGDVGVWGASFESMSDYYKGLDRLQLQISRIDKLSEFSLVNKVLLNQ